jgi:hypothetical protein
MTDRIGIDEQIAYFECAMEDAVATTIPFGPHLVAIHATLRDYKRIQEAKVPEEPLIATQVRDTALTTWVSARDLTFVNYSDALLDLLRRETAKNERIKELLREPSVKMCDFKTAGVHWQTGERIFKAYAAALLAEVEQAQN